MCRAPANIGQFDLGLDATIGEFLCLLRDLGADLILVNARKLSTLCGRVLRDMRNDDVRLLLLCELGRDRDRLLRSV